MPDITVSRARRNCSNVSLFLYRYAPNFLPAVPEEQNAEQEQKARQSLIAQANREYCEPEQQALLNALQQRQEQHLKAYAHSPGTLTATVAWRLAIGLGYGKAGDAPSLQLHPLYGVPYIPASSLKGALAHYAAECEWTPDEIATLFGGPDRRGQVVILDSFPLPQNRGDYLKPDVINNHYVPYYQGAANQVAPPADYWDPRLISFVTVAKGVRFCFRWGAATEEQSREFDQLLRDCCLHYGLGAKTRANYGRLICDAPRKNGGAV